MSHKKNEKQKILNRQSESEGKATSLHSSLRSTAYLAHNIFERIVCVFPYSYSMLYETTTETSTA